MRFIPALLLILTTLLHGADDDFKQLFNGTDLTGWEGETKLWSVKDGAIVGETTKENPAKGNTFLIWKGGTVKDFELHVMFRLTGSNNSGIQYRSKDLGKFVCSGYQYDINSGFPQMGKLYEEKGSRQRMAMGGEQVTFNAAGKKVTGEVGPPDKLKTAEKTKEWNEAVIIARGSRLIHKINDVVTIDLTDDDAAKHALVGILGLQIHAGAPMKIEFKDIRYKELAPEK